MSGDVQTRQRRKEKKKQKRGKYGFIKIIDDKEKKLSRTKKNFFKRAYNSINSIRKLLETQKIYNFYINFTYTTTMSNILYLFLAKSAMYFLCYYLVSFF